MSYSVDVNILLYASAQSSENHEAAVAFLERCRRDHTLWYLTWPTLMGYLRMATHASILSPPLSAPQATKNVEALLGLPQVRLISEQEGFWEEYCEVTQGMAVRGKLVPDAHLAALLRQHGIRTLYTNDRDFLKFPFLQVKNPLSLS
jgi:toxin-antitoxin system PIN domain toxin